MGRLLYKPQYRDLVWGAGLLCALLALLCWPQESTAAVREGLSLCGNVILPSLFPFFVLSSLVVELGMSRYLGKLLEPVMRPLFRVGGSCASALALGFVGGYPVGAQTAIHLYRSGGCSKTEAERLLAFCNNSGPAFILGVVGVGIFGSSLVGLLLYLTHILSSLLVGILFRFYKMDQPLPPSKPTWSIQAISFPVAFTRSVTGALTSTFHICSFVLFFTVFLRCLSLSGIMALCSDLIALVFSPFGLTSPWAQRLLTGLIEVSSGVSTLTTGSSLGGRISMAAFMLGWAGLSVHCQVLSFLGDSGLSVKTYFCGKALHALFSAGLTCALLSQLHLEQSAAAYLLEQVETLAGLNFHRVIFITTLCALGTGLLFFVLTAHLSKKSSRKPGRHAL